MKASNYLAISISIILALSIMFAILFVKDIGIKDIHGNFNIPENDLQCGTEWIVMVNDHVDFATFEKLLRSEISEFGHPYDVSQRNITLVDLGDSRVHITIEGLWEINPDRPNLKTSIVEIDHVEQIEESEGGSVSAWCQ